MDVGVFYCFNLDNLVYEKLSSSIYTILEENLTAFL